MGNIKFIGKGYVVGQQPTVSSFDSDAQAFFTASGLSDSGQRTAVNNLVVALKAASIWTKMLAIYPIVGGTAALHKWNLKNPLDTDAAFRLVFPNGATHSATGLDWNGTTQYANTFFIPATHGMTASSGHLSYYSRQDQIAGDYAEMGALGSGTQEQSLIIKAGDSTFYPVHTDGAGPYPNLATADATGFWISNRNSSTNTTGFRNGTKIIDGAQQGGVSSAVVYIGCQNSNGAPVKFTQKECAFISIGQGLTDAEATAFSTAVANYQTTLSRNV